MHVGFTAQVQYFHLGMILCTSVAAGVHGDRYNMLGHLSFGYGLLLFRNLSTSGIEAVLWGLLPPSYTYALTH